MRRFSPGAPKPLLLPSTKNNSNCLPLPIPKNIDEWLKLSRKEQDQFPIEFLQSLLPTNVKNPGIQGSDWIPIRNASAIVMISFPKWDKRKLDPEILIAEHARLDENHRHLPTLWAPPGGGMNDDETPLEALVREVSEEMGEIDLRTELIQTQGRQLEPIDILKDKHLLRLNITIVDVNPNQKEIMSKLRPDRDPELLSTRWVALMDFLDSRWRRKERIHPRGGIIPTLNKILSEIM